MVAHLMIRPIPDQCAHIRQATNYGNGVTVDITERPYIVGAFQGEMCFVNSTYMGNFTLVSHGPKSDFFLLRIGRVCLISWPSST